jgi:integrase
MRGKSNPGIVERHSRSCASRAGEACNCEPSYMAWAWDRRAGKKVYVTFSGRGAKSAAKQWRSDAVGQIRRGTLRPPTKKTVRTAWTEFMAAVTSGEVFSRYRRPYSPSALRTYESDFRRFIDPELGATRLDDVRRGDVQAFIDRLNGRGLSGSRVRGIVTPLQALYRWADKRDMVTIDPTVNLELPALGGRRERVATPIEAAALLAALPDEDRALWACAAYAGLRRGELRALRVSNVRASSISVEHGWDDKAGERETKSAAGIREVPLPAILRTILDAHLERTGRGGEALIFGRAAAEPFTPSHVRKRAREAWAAAELEPIGLHELRHSYSSYLDAAGVSETRADRYMGHSNPSVANRYRHQLEGQLVEDAKRLDKYLKGAAAGKVVPIRTGAQTGAQGTVLRSTMRLSASIA